MKAKSVKLRTLVTLKTLYKYTDENHPLNGITINEFLKPLNLDFKSHAFSEMIRDMKEFGLEIHKKGAGEKRGFYIANRPLNDDSLNDLTIAITTNPYITKEKKYEILDTIKPFITVYQEENLKGFVDIQNETINNTDICRIYKIVCNSIETGRRIKYKTLRMKYNRKPMQLSSCNSTPVFFTPKCIYQKNREIYMLGYNHIDKKVTSVNLNSISDIRLEVFNKEPNPEDAKMILENIDSTSYINELTRKLIYSGKVIFKCRSKHVDYLLNHFGPPSEPIEIDNRGKYIYVVDNAEITTETLFDLSNMPNNDIRILGPENLSNIVKDYYAELSKKILNPHF